MLGKLRLILWGLVAVAVAALVFLLTRPAPELPAPTTTEMPLASIGGPFTLVGGDGQPFSSARLAGKPFAIFFGFTHCPDVCPTTLAEMKGVLDKLGPDDARRVQVLFVTIDPKRDTPALLANYVPAFHPSFLGLVGSPEATAKMAKDFKVFYQKVPGKTPGSYSMDHSAGSYVYDPQGRLRLFVRHGMPLEGLVADFKLLLGGQ